MGKEIREQKIRALERLAEKDIKKSEEASLIKDEVYYLSKAIYYQQKITNELLKKIYEDK